VVIKEAGVSVEAKNEKSQREYNEPNEQNAKKNAQKDSSNAH
jgi:hypothetical protein